ncbi:MAG: response regulator [Thermoguttaceae bacterium]|nr:response regulator [Thermoguttaceae bacterium]
MFVVDNDPQARAGVAALATSMGIRCRTFASAEDFLGDYTHKWTGCALVDLRLGGMNGLELLAKLAEVGSTLPVILISAHVDFVAAARATNHGAVTVLEKPYQADDLANAIREAMARHCQGRGRN